VNKGWCIHLKKGKSCPAGIEPVTARVADICCWLARREEEINSLQKGEIQVFFAGRKVSGKLIEFVEEII